MSCPKIEDVEQLARDVRQGGTPQGALWTHVAECTDCRQMLDDVAANLSCAARLVKPGSPAAETLPRGGSAWDKTETTPILSPTAGEPGTADPGMVVPGRLNNVRLIREIGRGGMGVVWLGHDELLGRDVAVKFLSGARAAPNDPGFATFIQGARAAARIRHPALTVIYHADVVDGTPYLVMEYIDGPTLGDILRQSGRLSASAAVTVLVPVCEAIAQLHDGGIIHRDIKPSNVLLDQAGRVYVTDFGLVCPRPAGGGGRPAEVAGTPPYMAPELFEGVASARSDVYALGILAFEMLTGHLPFTGTLVELRHQHRAAPLPVHLLDGHADAAWSEILQRATHKDALFRYRSAQQLLRALEPIADASTSRAAAGMAELRERVARCGSDRPARPAAGQTPTPGASYYDHISQRATARRQGRTTPPALQLPAEAPAPRLDEERHAPAPAAPPTKPEADNAVRCVGCGYDLHGLAPGRHCPECNTPVARSLLGEKLSIADKEWLKRVYRGQRYLAVGGLLTGLMAVAGMPLVAWGFSVAPPVVDELLEGFVLLMSIAPMIVALLGVYGLTAREPRLAMTEEPITLRRLARSAAVVALVAYFARDAAGTLSMLKGAFTMPHILWQILTWTFLGAALVTIGSAGLYLARLMERVPDHALSRKMRTRSIQLVILPIVAVAVARIIPAWADSVVPGGRLLSTYELADHSRVLVFVKLTGQFCGIAAFACLVGLAIAWVRSARILKRVLGEQSDAAGGPTSAK